MDDTAAHDDADLDEADERVIDFSAPAADNEPWRRRAREYNSTYKGPEHWVHAINVIAATGSIALACREAGITHGLFTRRRERYAEFGEHVHAALQSFREGILEKAAVTRAVDGWLEPVFYKGEQVGTVRKYSDTLLNKLLEGNMPEKYRSKSDNTPAGNTITFVGGLPDDPEDATPAAPIAPKTDPEDPLA